MRAHYWTRLLLTLAFLRLFVVMAASVLARVSVPVDLDNGYRIPPVMNFLAQAVFGGVAFLLVAAGRRDSRAISLAGFFVLIANAFCSRAILEMSQMGDSLGSLATSLGSLRLDIFMPFFFLRFVREFPRAHVSRWMRRGLEGLIAFCAFAGCFLLAVAYVVALLRVSRSHPFLLRFLTPLAPLTGGGPYFLVELLPLVPGLALLGWKARAAGGEERRRVRLFSAALLTGLAPAMLELTCELCLPGYRGFMHRHLDFARWTATAVIAASFTVPLITAYSVLVHRVLDARLVARRAVQYALARYTAVALVAVPIVAALAFLYANRDLKLSQIFSGPSLVVLLSVAFAGSAALHYRTRLLDAIDRRFFREQYDARHILSLLVDRVRAVHEGAELAQLITRELDLALHLETVAMMVIDSRTGVLFDPDDRGRRLDTSTMLVNLISGSSEPLAIRLTDLRSPVSRLPEKERHWLVDSGYQLIVPVLGRDGSLLGLVGLGAKKSGLPFLREDLQLLRTIASSAAWVLEFEQSQTLTGTLGTRSRDVAYADIEAPMEPLFTATEHAKECANCGTLYQSYNVFCARCSRRLDPSHVPFVLPGKFRIERRIGSGGMGLVYRGSDLALGRPVAIKTMRRISPEDAMRLRREARTTAAVSHPHLAAVYGIETWQGTPMLILELLEGGTLTQRIAQGNLTEVETVELGIAMAAALARLHAVDILHRDIKPSNIGYTGDGIPKLMDFGIARAMFDMRRDKGDFANDGDEDHSFQLAPTSIWNQTSSTGSGSRQVVGTLAYLSPEALDGRQADPSFDLWSLAIVLYECLLGKKVFGGGEPRQIMGRIRHGRVPDFSQVCPGHSAALADFFRSALHRTPSRRPATAIELQQRLAQVRRQLA